MNAVSWLLVVFACPLAQDPPDPTRTIVEAWASKDRETVLKAAQTTIDRWESWTEAQLRTLNQAAQLPGLHRQEVQDALRTIALRKTLGAVIMKEIPKADEWASGDTRMRMLLIDRAIARGQQGTLDEETLHRLAQFVRASKWDLQEDYVLTLAVHRPFRGLAVDLLASPKANVRSRAALALGRTGCADQAAALTTALKDEAPAVRHACATALMLADVRPAPGALHDLLTDDDAGVRAAAVRALGWLNGKGARADVSRLLSDPKEEVRIAAIGATTWAGGLDDDQIRTLLNDASPGIRRTLAKVLRSHSTAAALDGLLVLAGDAVEGVKIDAYLSLGWRVGTLDSGDRGSVVAKLREVLDRKRAKNQTDHTVAAAQVALMRAGEAPSNLVELHLTCTGGTEELYGELCVSLLERFHPEIAAGLGKELELTEPIVSYQDMARVLLPLGVKFDPQDRIPFSGRLIAGRKTTGWTLLSRLPGDCVIAVGENSLRIVRAVEGFKHWTARLAPKK